VIAANTQESYCVEGFLLLAMTRCGANLRHLAADKLTLEEADEAIVRHL